MAQDIDLDRLERLAAVRLSAAERARLREELSKLLDYVDQLQEIDDARLSAELESAPPVRLRDDEPQPGLGTDRALSLAPARHEDSIDAPGALGGGE